MLPSERQGTRGNRHVNKPVRGQCEAGRGATGVVRRKSLRARVAGATDRREKLGRCSIGTEDGCGGWTLGDAEAIPLATARTRARAAIVAASAGSDPAAVKKAERTAETVADLVDLYLHKHARPKKKSWRARTKRRCERDVLPAGGPRAVQEITRADCRHLVERPWRRACHLIGANRLAALLSRLFTFAVDRDLATVNAAYRIPKPAQEHARQRVLHR